MKCDSCAQGYYGFPNCQGMKSKPYWYCIFVTMIVNCVISTRYNVGFIWNFAILNGCSTKTMHIWPYVGKAKMCLRESLIEYRHILQFQIAVAQKRCIFDPMLKKPKCVWEAVVFFFQFSTKCLHFST